MIEYSEKERKLYSIFEKFYVCELEWTDINVMGEDEFTKLEHNLASLERQIVLLRNRQPDCRKLLERYDGEFSKYSAEVESILEGNNGERHKLKGYLFSKERIETLRKTTEELRKVINDNWSLLDERTIEYSTRIWWKLVSLGKDVETDKSRFFDCLEKMVKTLEINHSTLIALLQPTHEWGSESAEKKRCAKCSKEMVEITESKRTYKFAAMEKKRPIRDSDGYLPPV